MSEHQADMSFKPPLLKNNHCVGTILFYNSHALMHGKKATHNVLAHA